LVDVSFHERLTWPLTRADVNAVGALGGEGVTMGVRITFFVLVPGQATRL
jgi:hypothetical protein